MKTLRKILLANWHGFFRTLLPVQGSLLLTGENGSGKSTLLDALYFLLSGGDERHFNKAANDDGERSLESYMRGKTGKENNPVLRNDPNVISHIALEFYDDIERVPMTIGVVMEIQENSNLIGRSFYHLKNTAISEDLYFTLDESGKQVIRNFRSMKKLLNESILVEITGKRSDIRTKIYAALSIDDKRYYTLLSSALAFRPIRDVGDFVYKFLMPERNVDIMNIRNTIQSYRDLNTRIIEDLYKKEHLEKIKETGDSLKKTHLSILLHHAMKHDIERERSESEIERNRTIIRESEIHLSESENRKKILNSDIEDISNTINDLKNNETLRALNELNINLSHENEKLDDLTKEESAFNRMLLLEDELCMKAGFNPGLAEKIMTRDFASLMKTAEQHSKKIDALRLSTEKEYYSFVEEEKVISDKLHKLEDRKRDLEKGLHEYPTQFKNLQDAIRRNILEKTGEDIVLRPICERMDIPDTTGEEWRNAIEGTLGDRRFDLIIPHKVYPEALEAYLKEKGPRNIYRMGIVDESECRRDISDDASSDNKNLLSTMVVSEDPIIDAHLKACLAGVVCTTEQDLAFHENAVTSSCMRKVGDTVFHMSPSEYSRPYIGLEAIRIQMDKTKAEIEETEAVLKEIKEKKDEKGRLKRIFDNSHIRTILSQKDVWSRKDSCQNHVKELLVRKKDLEAECGKIVHDIDSFEEKKRQKVHERNETDRLINELSSAIAVSKDHVQAAQARAEEAKKHFDSLISSDRDIKAFNEFKAKGKIGLNQVNEQIRILEEKFEIQKQSILNEMTKYIVSFDFDSVSSLDSLDTFEMEYNTVVTRDLATYQTKLNEARAQATTLFQNSYVSEIRRNIKEERRNIDKLNKVLADKPFGYDGEVYQFVISKSKDPDFADYYEIFTSNEDYNVNDLFTEQLSQKNSNLLKELFDMLTRESTTKDEDKAIRNYTDYRKFMSYDIRIRNKAGDETYFSKINREKSGGETQTPFYVILAASFNQISQNNRKGPSGCLFLIDEAFSTMDSAHIEALMKYCSELAVQPIISVPPERARTIFPYVDTVVGIVKVHDVIQPRPFVKEQK